MDTKTTINLPEHKWFPTMQDMFDWYCTHALNIVAGQVIIDDNLQLLSLDNTIFDPNHDMYYGLSDFSKSYDNYTIPVFTDIPTKMVINVQTGNGKIRLFLLYLHSLFKIFPLRDYSNHYKCSRAVIVRPEKTNTEIMAYKLTNDLSNRVVDIIIDRKKHNHNCDRCNKPILLSERANICIYCEYWCFIREYDTICIHETNITNINDLLYIARFCGYRHGNVKYKRPFKYDKKKYYICDSYNTLYSYVLQLPADEIIIPKWLNY